MINNSTISIQIFYNIYIYLMIYLCTTKYAYINDKEQL